MALLRDGIELVVGSVGDSRAMLCRKGKALKLTVDHTPERKDEKERYHDAVSCATDSCATCSGNVFRFIIIVIPINHSQYCSRWVLLVLIVMTHMY